MTATRPAGYRVRGVCFSYGSRQCLHHLTLDLEPGYLYGLIGPNGSGKSTLLDILSGYAAASAGSVSLDGRELGRYRRVELARLLTAVPQSFSLNFDYTVHDVVLMGRHPHLSRFSAPAEGDFSHVEEALRLMGIWELRQRRVRALSGGEKQRVMIARALAQDCTYLLLDEVTANLDINHGISIMKTMTGLVRRHGCTVLAALHDLNMALAFCDRIIALQNGTLCGFGPADEVISESLIRELYGVTSHIDRLPGETRSIRYLYH